MQHHIQVAERKTNRGPLEVAAVLIMELSGDTNLNRTFKYT